MGKKPSSMTKDKKKLANIYNYNNDEVVTAMLRKYCDNCKTKGKILLKPVTATRDLEGWKKITDNRPHYVNKEKGCIVFFCAIQNKWHMYGPKGIYYRVDDNGKTELPKKGWNSKKMKGADNETEIS